MCVRAGISEIYVFNGSGTNDKLSLGIDTNGLDQMDQNYLRHLIHDHSGGPVGLDTLAAQLGEQKDVVEDVIEPYLIQKGFIQKTTRGRSATETALKNLDLKNNDKLFNNE